MDWLDLALRDFPPTDSQQLQKREGLLSLFVGFKIDKYGLSLAILSDHQRFSFRLQLTQNLSSIGFDKTDRLNLTRKVHGLNLDQIQTKC